MTSLASTFALAASLFHEGAFGAADVTASLFAVLPALGGMWLGQIVRARVSAQVFRRCFFLGLLALGLHLASRAFL